MADKIVKPRCPNCGKVVGDWLRGEAGYTCRHCHVGFTISTANTAYIGGLTKVQNCANSILT